MNIEDWLTDYSKDDEYSARQNYILISAEEQYKQYKQLYKPSTAPVKIIDIVTKVETIYMLLDVPGSIDWSSIFTAYIYAIYQCCNE